MNTEKKFLVLHRYEDELHVQVVTREKLEKRLSEGDYGHGIQWLSEWPSSLSIEYWPARTGVILSADIVVPQALEVITRWKIGE
jgi:hypothetical protein